MKKTGLIVSGAVIAVVAAYLGFYLQQKAPVVTPRSSVVTEKFHIKGVTGGVPAFRSANDMPGQQRPDFTLPDQQGRDRHVKEWDGQVLVINFWATWCPPCRKEIPEFIELQNEYGGQGLQFVGIALEKAEDVTDYAREMGINYPILTGELSAIRIAEEYGNQTGALPYTVIIDRNQVIRHVQQGVLSREKAIEIIAPLL